jgi:hypothetical protein
MSELTGGCLVSSFIHGCLAVRCNNYFVKKKTYLFIFYYSFDKDIKIILMYF